MTERKAGETDRFLLENQHFAQYLQKQRRRLVEHLFAVAEIMDPARPALHRSKSLPSLSEVADMCRAWMEETQTERQKEPVSAATLGERISQLIWEWVDWLDVAVGEWIVCVERVAVELWIEGNWAEVEKQAHTLQRVLQELLETIYKLERGLNKYAEVHKQSKKKFFFFRQPWLDPRLLPRVAEWKSFVKKHMGIFGSGWHLYQKEREKWSFSSEEKSTLKISAEQGRACEIFCTLLSLQEQEGVYPKGLQEALNQTLKKQAKSRKNFFCFVVEVFRRRLCDVSWDWKKENASEKTATCRQAEIRNILEEMARLSQCMGRFRTFLLTHHPNPYLRTRWGFTEWVAGPESPIAKQMVVLIEEMEELRATGEVFFVSLGKDRAEKLRLEEGAWHKIRHILHEMGSPFANLAQSQRMAEQFVEQLAIWDEFGAFASVRVTETGRLLSAAIREDWKFCSLSRLPAFRKLYQWHRLLWPLKEETIFLPFWNALDGVLHLATSHQNRWEETSDEALDKFFGIMKKALTALTESVQNGLKTSSGELAERSASEAYRELLLDYRVRFREKVALLQEELCTQIGQEFFFVEQAFWQTENLLDL